MQSLESRATPTNASGKAVSIAAKAKPTLLGESLDAQMVADRYGWSAPMARWWMSFAASSVGPKPEAMIAFLDRTVGGVTMIRRR